MAEETGPWTPETETDPEVLRQRLTAVLTALTNTRRDLMLCRSRLALIARIARNQCQVKRDPETAFAAVRAALHGNPDDRSRM
jgi:hypothetical protein